MLTAVILARDEERHIARAIASAQTVCERTVVVDSGSTDRTREIAVEMGAQVLENPWKNYATQFNWALAQLPADTDWVLRLDADEILDERLQQEIRGQLAELNPETDGAYVSRRMNFLGSPVRWGGVFPIRVLRLFRFGKGRCEDRWMDEHIVVTGNVSHFSGEIIDDNLNTLTWWIAKHNTYASREAIDLLNLEFGFMPHDSVAKLRGGQQAGKKRWLKERVYSRLPSGFRAFTYFFYRFALRLGFLDGPRGAAFHVLQGFWYRYLVDAKLLEVKTYMREAGVDAVTAIDEKLGIKLDAGR